MPTQQLEQGGVGLFRLWGYSDIFFSLWEKLHNYPENSLFKEV